MTIADILRTCLTNAPIQFVNECVTAAQANKGNRKQGVPPHTKITFATQHMTPNDLMYLSNPAWRTEPRKPKYFGIIVWVPRDEYERATDAEEPADVGNEDLIARLQMEIAGLKAALASATELPPSGGAVDPSVADPGTPTPRDKGSS